MSTARDASASTSAIPGLGSDLTGEPLLSAPHYYWGCCIICRRPGTSAEPLKRCARCNCLYYCSKEHQKKHWRRHRDLCEHLSSSVGQQSIFFGRSDKESYRSSRMSALCTAERMLRRKLEEWEKEMFLFPRACRRCWATKKSGMLDCPDCMCVSYCSEECQEKDATVHSAETVCKELRYAMACDNFECSVNIAVPPLPSDLDNSFMGTPANMDAFLEQTADRSSSSNGDKIDSGLAIMEKKFLTDRLSGPMTLLQAVSLKLARGISVETAAHLVIHVVGANVMEMLGMIKWEVLGHRLPQCLNLRLVFIGPELEAHEGQDGECPWLEPCAECRKKNKSVVYEIRRGTYEKYASSEAYIVPDLVAAFNCGFHEFELQPDKETWRPSLPLLVRHPGVPLVFTSYTLTEALKDLKLIKEACEELLVDVAAERNPFRSQRPIRDFEFDGGNDVFYSNNYYSVVRRQG